MDSLPIAIPAAPVPARKPPTPFIAALVPVAAGVALWLVTGSLFSLCFAVLGPLMIVASLIDGSRSRRRASRAAATDSAAAWSLAEAQLTRLHEDERRLRWHRHPDAAACLAQSPLRGLEPPDAAILVVVGSGTGDSAVQASGGDGDRERDFRMRCTRVEGVPTTVPLGSGIALRGSSPVVAAAARALVVQLCLRFGVAQMSVAGSRLDELGLAGFPHARFERRGSFRLAVARGADPRPPADAVIWLLDRDGTVPEGVTTVIDIAEPRRASIRTPQGIAEVEAECLSHDQTVAIGASRAEGGDDLDSLPASVSFGELFQPESTDGLPAVVGRGEREDILLDIVDDGPHAIVTGTTGTGKSELLVSWVTAMASGHGPDRVTFVLADFKGGTAFEPLRMLPQVAAVITDLDEEGARRGVSSLTAELRRRESVLADAGARDIREIGMARLVIVVDEFAALLHDHPDLGAVFTDIAARGRALGMHLILGTQRASGVIRDALAANCPLRVSLRVADAADSRAVIGADDAAELPGGVASRGLALARRPQDAEPIAMRVALTGVADLRAVALRWADADTPVSPWLPPLPRILPLAQLQAQARTNSGVILGRADDPERQDQPLELLSIGSDRGIVFLGGSGSGRSSALRALARQHAAPLWVPTDPEQSWDAVVALAEHGSPRGGLILCDDVDVRIGELPVEYGQHLAQLWEQVLRNGAGTTIAITATKASAPLGRVLDALPRRGLLRMPSKVDHLAAGGDAAGFDAHRPPGRMRLGDREVQLPWVPEERLRSSAKASHSSRRREREGEGWTPRSAITALVTPGVSATAESLAAAYPECDVVLLDGATREARASTRPAMVLGDADVWQRHRTLWQRVRHEGEVLIRVENAAELRQLAGVREIPPYARSHAGRAWSLVGDSGPSRVVIPALAPRR
ncbi:FtsK/SpoIIIE domain-containing protein [Microbacterium sp. NPDC089320]|uniref:FtsK/SpoIIIE domain-containing protein n=1 Tax=Microbacterium sp. NPDC089320 TaxID=3155182 RepID=UPI00343B5AFD